MNSSPPPHHQRTPPPALCPSLPPLKRKKNPFTSRPISHPPPHPHLTRPPTPHSPQPPLPPPGLLLRQHHALLRRIILRTTSPDAIAMARITSQSRLRLLHSKKKPAAPTISAATTMPAIAPVLHDPVPRPLMHLVWLRSKSLSLKMNQKREEPHWDHIATSGEEEAGTRRRRTGRCRGSARRLRCRAGRVWSRHCVSVGEG